MAKSNGKGTIDKGSWYWVYIWRYFIDSYENYQDWKLNMVRLK